MLSAAGRPLLASYGPPSQLCVFLSPAFGPRVSAANFGPAGRPTTVAVVPDSLASVQWRLECCQLVSLVELQEARELSVVEEPHLGGCVCLLVALRVGFRYQ